MIMELKNERETLEAVATYFELGEPLEYKNIGHITFDLSVGAEVLSCGSVACIGGCAWLYENPNAPITEASQYVHRINADHQLCRLFYPASDVGFPNISYRAVTRKQAATAIRRYLAGEKLFWDHVEEESSHDET